MPGAGDAVREPEEDAAPLRDGGFKLSSTEIRRRVRGRRVDEGEPLAGFMAFESRAQWVRGEQHRTRHDCGCRKGAWHTVGVESSRGAHSQAGSGLTSWQQL